MIHFFKGKIKRMDDKEMQLHVDDEKGIAYMTINGKRSLGLEDEFLFVEYRPGVCFETRDFNSKEKDLIKRFKRKFKMPSNPNTKEKRYLERFTDLLLYRNYDAACEVLEKDIIYLLTLPKYNKYASYTIKGSIFGLCHENITTSALFKKLKALGFEKELDGDQELTPNYFRSLMEKHSKN